MSQELRQRIRPRSDEISSNEATSTFQNNSNGATHTPNRRHARPWMDYFAVSVHIAAILIVVMGFILRISFHSGVECEMTFSMRHFLLLENNVPRHPIYRLFKFTDLRDPRQRHLLQHVDATKEWSVLTSNHSQWCTAPANETTTIVLYIPGHWGSFSQARSLGAHGLQWTRQRHDARNQMSKLQRGEWNGLSLSNEEFVYDVYAIDFCEQGGALHANFLYAQSEYAAQVIESLVVCAIGMRLL